MENNPIALKVRTALNSNAAVVSSNYAVTATGGGEVHLRGVAPTEFEMEQALATAKKVPGVTSVVNDIAVGTQVNSK